ncbi:MAG: 5'/3'-nucleotidase SurE [Gemmatimonadota bacterium]|nr:5'/3'-nucleotidase SurE [Gemmatimonadota bacterium]
MKLIVTNDDGIDAEGLKTLVGLASRWGEVVVAAPAEPQSGVGHRLTTNGPVRVDRLTETRFRIWGTPADCARLALSRLAPDGDWLLSGINNGSNLGVDVYDSGTVAAAREAAILGCRAVALSHYREKDRTIDWRLAEKRLEPLLNKILGEALESGCFLSVNLPHPEHERVVLETRQAHVDSSPQMNTYTRTGDDYEYAGVYQERPRQPGSDIDTCFNGHISISKIRV